MQWTFPFALNRLEIRNNHNNNTNTKYVMQIYILNQKKNPIEYLCACVSDGPMKMKGGKSGVF